MIQDMKTILQLVRPAKGDSIRQRMESFYQHQSKDYDRFREKLLAGRQFMYQQSTKLAAGGTWVDFGAGTGASLDYLDDDVLKNFDKIFLVDVSNSLLEVAKQKIEKRELKNVEVVASEMLDFRPPDFADLVTFSYSLTMTPQWYKVLDHTYQILAPEGKIAVVDFYISEKHPMPGLAQHDSVTRHLWPAWFSYDNVFLNPDHLPYLLNKFDKVSLFEGYNRLPVIPLGKVPYYSFIGSKS